MSYPRTAKAKKQGNGSGNHLFGTSGIRGVVGQDLSTDFCQEVAQAIGATLAPHSKVGIATDTRVSRETIKRAVISGLRFSGIDIIDLGILPTPALAFLARDMGFDAGVMITASHNPPRFNGLKLFNGNGFGYSREQEAEIEKVYREKGFRAGYQGSLDRSQEGKERYFRFMQHGFPKGSLNHNLRIVVDPGNGAASGFASELFSRLGFEVIPTNDEPDGRFSGRNPEPKEDTLGGTIKFVRQRNADLAVCFDGDADRVVFCDREGFLGFNEMIAYISRLAIEETGKRTVATTVETGKLLDLAVEDIGAKVVRGKVGDVEVAYLSKEVDAAIGVEGVGVYILPQVGYYPDSILATLMLLSHIDHPSQIRESFQSLPLLSFAKTKVSCANEDKEKAMARLKEMSHLFGTNEINTIDGLRFEFGDSWMLIRASGTEPAIRVIAESTSKAETEVLISKGVEAVKKVQEN